MISNSSDQVDAGVEVVDKTGVALKGIITKVITMDGIIRQISAASKEQATGLAEIKTAVSHGDKVVQQNASMVEELTAAAHALKSEARDLSTMVERFDVGSETPSAIRHDHGGRGVPAKPRLTRRAKPVVALKTIPSSEQPQWEDV